MPTTAHSRPGHLAARVLHQGTFSFMGDPEILHDNCSDAIAIMTAWCSEDCTKLVNHLLEEIIQDDVERMGHLMGGLISLCGLMLVRSSSIEDVHPTTILQEIAAGPFPGINDDYY